jgi:hypothetical protein
VAFKEKGDDIKAFVTADTTSITLAEIIFENIAKGLEIHTDETEAIFYISQYNA